MSTTEAQTPALQNRILDLLRDHGSRTTWQISQALGFNVGQESQRVPVQRAMQALRHAGRVVLMADKITWADADSTCTACEERPRDGDDDFCTSCASTCTTCHGSGGGPDPETRCPQCHGTGRNPAYFSDEDPRV